MYRVGRRFCACSWFFDRDQLLCHSTFLTFSGKCGRGGDVGEGRRLRVTKMLQDITFMQFRGRHTVAFKNKHIPVTMTKAGRCDVGKRCCLVHVWRNAGLCMYVWFMPTYGAGVAGWDSK